VCVEHITWVKWSGEHGVSVHMLKTTVTPVINIISIICWRSGSVVSECIDSIEYL